MFWKLIYLTLIRLRILSKKKGLWPLLSILDKKEAAVQRCSVKKVFLEILQNSQENTCDSIS